MFPCQASHLGCFRMVGLVTAVAEEVLELSQHAGHLHQLSMTENKEVPDVCNKKEPVKSLLYLNVALGQHHPFMPPALDYGDKRVLISFNDETQNPLLSVMKYCHRHLLSVPHQYT